MPKKKKKIKLPLWAKGTGLILWGIVCALSLASYHKWDASWNTVSNRPYHNWLGCVGSWTADFLLQMVGVMAFTVPVFLVVLGVFCLLKKNALRWRFGAIVLAIFAACWMLGTKNTFLPDFFKAGIGGFVGYYLNAWYKPALWVKILGWMMVLGLLIISCGVSVGQMMISAGACISFVLHKMHLKVPEVLKKPFRFLYVRAQVCSVQACN